MIALKFAAMLATGITLWFVAMFALNALGQMLGKGLSSLLRRTS